MGISAAEVEAVADEGCKAQRLRRRSACPALLAVRQTRPRTSRRRPPRPLVALLHPHQSAGPGALSGVGLRLDARSRAIRRRRLAQSRPARPRHVSAPDRRGRAYHRRAAEPPRARMRRRGLRVRHAAFGERHPRHRRGRQRISARRYRRRVEARRPRRHPHHEGRRPEARHRRRATRCCRAPTSPRPISPRCATRSIIGSRAKLLRSACTIACAPCA